ncbi:RDD family protein [Thermophagus sp. OGC60D27]|uniref:RDD family protein n=1 Tax=Thermophagus sp. OGC60D27 TaxID=3458415 RepID=UPI004037BFDC
MKYFIERTLAYFIDCFIAFAVVMLMIQWAILSHIREFFGITDMWFQSSINMQLYVLTSISIPVWIYFAYFDSKKANGTFGKRIFKLEVRDNKNQKIGFGKSLFRAILKLLPWEIAHMGVIFPTPIYYENEPAVRIVSYVGLLLFAIYVISIWTDSRKRTIYDQVIGTIVSKK